MLYKKIMSIEYAFAVTQQTNKQQYFTILKLSLIPWLPR